MDPGKGKVPAKGSGGGGRSQSPTQSSSSRVTNLMLAMTRMATTAETSIRRPDNSPAVAVSAFGYNTFSIKIRSLDGKTTTLQAKASWTVKKLKEEFAKYRGEGWENVVLLYRGKRLKDEELLSTYNVEPDSFIQANFRSKGGSGYYLCALASAQKELKLFIGVGCGCFISIC